MQDIFVVPAEFVKKQISASLDDVGADVIKLGMAQQHPLPLGYSAIDSVVSDRWTNLSEGMLSSAETIDIIADALTSYQIPAVVLDPVLQQAFPASFILTKKKNR